MDRSEQLNELAPALAKTQAALRLAKEDRTNPAFKSRYATLSSVWEACREALGSNGLSVVQMPVPSPEGFLYLETILLHESGQFLAGTTTMPLAKCDPQGYGSALTYARRYALSSVLGICEGDDDDAQSATPPRPQQQSRPAVESSGDRSATAPKPAAPPASAPQATAGDAMACSRPDCGKPLTKGQHDVSIRAFGQPLCPQHQKEHVRTA